MSKMYTGAGRLFQEVSPLPMDEEGLLDMKRRIKLQPHFLGEPLVVVAEADDFPGICVPGVRLYLPSLSLQDIRIFLKDIRNSHVFWIKVFSVM